MIKIALCFISDIAVKFFQEAAPRELGKVDHYYAASVSR